VLCGRKMQKKLDNIILSGWLIDWVHVKYSSIGDKEPVSEM